MSTSTVIDLSQASVRDLLVEIERRGIRMSERGDYPTLGIDMAIGARSLLDLLPGSVLNQAMETPT